MKNLQKGFIGLPVLIAIVLGIIVLGGGTYFFMQQQSSSQVSPTSNSQSQQQPSQPTTSITPSSVSTKEISNLKTYRNEKYGYSFNYPKSYSAFEWPGQYKGEKPYLVVAVGNKDSMEITPVDLLNTDDALGSSWLRVNRENGTAWISGSKIVDDFWSKLSKMDDKGNVVNVFVKKQSTHGIDFIIFNQKNWDISSQSYLWSPQALFMYNGNFFWVSSSPQMGKDTFDSILNSFTVGSTATKTTPPTSSSGTPTITILLPNGGEGIVKGKTYKITWKTSTSFNSAYPKVSITLITAKGKQGVTPDQKIITDNTGSYDWIVPSAQLSGSIQDFSGGPYTVRTLDDYTDFQFLIEGYPHTTGRAEDPFDYSDSSFTIYTPNPGGGGM